MNSRELLREEYKHAAALRDIHPQMAELRVEFEFHGGTGQVPSPVKYAYFPAARGFFRYPCPRHCCSGEFDLSVQIADFAAGRRRSSQDRLFQASCTGLRGEPQYAGAICLLSADIRVSATLHTQEPSR